MGWKRKEGEEVETEEEEVERGKKREKEKGFPSCPFLQKGAPPSSLVLPSRLSPSFKPHLILLLALVDTAALVIVRRATLPGGRARRHDGCSATASDALSFFFFFLLLPFDSLVSGVDRPTTLEPPAFPARGNNRGLCPVPLRGEGGSGEGERKRTPRAKRKNRVEMRWGKKVPIFRRQKLLLIFFDDDDE